MSEVWWEGELIVTPAWMSPRVSLVNPACALVRARLSGKLGRRAMFSFQMYLKEEIN